MLTAGAAAAQDARFTVSDEVIAPDPGPFTATVTGLGNGAETIRRNTAFEPVILRNKLHLAADSANRLIVDPGALTRWQTFNGALFNGAEVEVLRIVDGRLTVVRRDRVAPRGYRPGGWVAHTPFGMVAPPDRTTITVPLSHHRRLGDTVWFTVRALNRRGQASAPATPAPVRIEGPLKQGRFTGLKRFRRGGSSWLSSGPPDAPRGLTATLTPQGVRLSWRDVRGAAGYQVFRSEAAPGTGFRDELVLEGSGPPLRKGDMVFLSASLTRFEKADIVPPRHWNNPRNARLLSPVLIRTLSGGTPGVSWRLSPHGPEAHAGRGETYLDATLEAQAKLEIRAPVLGGIGRDFYRVPMGGESFVAEALVRADRPMTVTLALDGAPSKPRKTVTLTGDGQWRRLSLTTTFAATPRHSRAIILTLTAQGPGRIGIDNFRFRSADTPYLAAMEVTKDRLRRSGMGALRFHDLIKTGMRTYDLRQVLSVDGGVSGSIRQANLHSLLTITREVGADPWIQIEPHLSEAEWRGLFEYLAAPFDPAIHSARDRPWAALRAAQGQGAPWTDQFDRILFEVGNETWSTIFQPWTFRNSMPDQSTGAVYRAPAVYGLFHDRVMGIFRNSPYWTPAIAEKFTSVLGGWTARPAFTEGAAMASATADAIAMTSYIGGWEADADIPRARPQDYFNVLTWPLRLRSDRGATLKRIAREAGAARGRPYGLATYEGGPGYVLDGLNGRKVSKQEAAVQERVMKSIAAGSATLDAFLGLAEDGFTVQNFFTFSEGGTWSSHRRAGGAAYPGWMYLTLYNRIARGDFLRVEATRNLTADIGPIRKFDGMRDVPLIGLRAIREGDRLIVIASSRRVPGMDAEGGGPADVLVDLPIASAASMKRYRIDGGYADQNYEADTLALRIEDLPPPEVAQLAIRQLPPGSSEFYVLNGVDWN